MITREIAMTENTGLFATARFTAAQRLRLASLVFNLSTLVIVAAPTIYTHGLKAIHFVFIACLFLGGWAVITLARDQRLKVLMAFGSRSSREAVAKSLKKPPQKVVLDEFDFHLRSEAFRISYQIIATLVALVACAGFLFQAFSDVQVNWGIALMLTFPFGILWLLALPTSVVVWLDNPAADSDGEQP